MESKREIKNPLRKLKKNSKDIKTKEDLEDEENEEYFTKYFKTKLIISLEKINSLKKENEELKKQSQDGDHDVDKTRKEV